MDEKSEPRPNRLGRIDKLKSFADYGDFRQKAEKSFSDDTNKIPSEADGKDAPPRTNGNRSR